MSNDTNANVGPDDDVPALAGNWTGPMSLKEMAAVLGFSPRAVRDALQPFGLVELRRGGFIARLDGMPANWRLALRAHTPTPTPTDA